MIDSSFEFRVGENVFRAGKIDPFTQWGIIQRLAPLIGTFTAMATAKQPDTADSQDEAQQLRAKSAPIMEAALKAVASLPDADSRFIMTACLGVCERQSGSSWFRIWNKQANALQFQEIELLDMLRITLEVLRNSLTGFFPELRSILSGEDQAA